MTCPRPCLSGFYMSCGKRGVERLTWHNIEVLQWILAPVTTATVKIQQESRMLQVAARVDR
jgi:hypothetical protein